MISILTIRHRKKRYTSNAFELLYRNQIADSVRILVYRVSRFTQLE
jgi:hypothetical protein